MKNIILTLAGLSLICHSSFASSPEVTTPIHRHRGRSKALFNKNLKITGLGWEPFWIWTCPDGTKTNFGDCPTKGNMSYGGVLWELLLMIQKRRKVSFTLYIPREKSWGICYSKNNCTGMVGMVNREDVDLALGSTY